MGGTGLVPIALLALAAAAPPLPDKPKPRPPILESNDENLDREAWQYAEVLVQLADRVSAEYVTPISAKDLLVAAASETYAAAGLQLPKHLRERIERANGPDQTMAAMHLVRSALGRPEGLDGVRATVAGIAGFNKVTDPYGGLFAQRGTSFASSDAEFGLGFELVGATGEPWLAYQVDLNQMLGRRTSANPPAPVAVPWTVKRVIPGSPAARAGLRPGDAITHIGGDKVTARSSNQLFRRLATVVQPDFRAPGEPVDADKPIEFRVDRPGTPTDLELRIARENYSPESVFGVARKADGTWDYLLDRTAKIGYIRVTSVESGSAAAFKDALDDLVEAKAKGLVLDLRWCPGGYVDPTTRIAAIFLPPGKEIAKFTFRNVERGGRQEFQSEPAAGREAYIDLPLVVLVGPETTGGGEMIAAALQDHGRAKIVGQRTFGKANIMTPIATRYPGLLYKVTTGYSLRPNGTPRHRTPDSKPTDAWGVKPDKGYELPLTSDLLAELKESAERQAIRPPDDRTAVALDDPLADPQRLVAARFLKEQIKK